MPECPRCHGANLIKTVFGTFKCPQCLYEEGKFNPSLPIRKKGLEPLATPKKRGQNPPSARYHYSSQSSLMKLIAAASEENKPRSARLSAIRALGEKRDPRALDLLMSFLDHQDIDFEEYARRAIESINSQQMKQNIMQSRPSAEKKE